VILVAGDSGPIPYYGTYDSASFPLHSESAPALSTLILHLRTPNRPVTIRPVKRFILRWAQNSIYTQVTSYISGSLAGSARMRIGSTSVVLDIQVLRFSTEQSGRSSAPDRWSHAHCRAVGLGL